MYDVGYGIVVDFRCCHDVWVMRRTPCSVYTTRVVMIFDEELTPRRRVCAKLLCISVYTSTCGHMFVVSWLGDIIHYVADIVVVVKTDAATQTCIVVVASVVVVVVMVVVAGNADSRVSRNNNNNNNNDLAIDDSDLNWLQPMVVALKVFKMLPFYLWNGTNYIQWTVGPERATLFTHVAEIDRWIVYRFHR